MKIKLNRVPLAGLAAGAANAGGNFLGNLAISNIENERYQENQIQNFKLAQVAQREAGSNQKTALANAGVSPAVMNGGNFQTATPNQAPMQNKQVNMNFMEAAMQSQQLKLLSAQAEQQEIINERMKDEDSTYNAGMKSQFLNIADQLEAEGSNVAAGVYRKLAESKEFFSKGTFDSWNQTIKMLGNANEQNRRNIQERFQAAVQQKKITTPDVLEAEAMLSKEQFNKVLSEIAKLDVDKVLSVTAAGKNTAQINLIGSQINEVVAHISELLSSAALNDVAAQTKYHSDFAAMIQNNDYSAAASTLLANIVQDVVPAVVTRGKSVSAQIGREVDDAPFGLNQPKNSTIRDSNRPLVLRDDGSPMLVKRKDGTYTSIAKRSSKPRNSAFPAQD